ncbi:MAG: nucleotidyltransferase domain-containing protein [Bacteroidales bacterium]|nr:nucleotidyltransferase domain-containing protein [Bacteroidales bacterium]
MKSLAIFGSYARKEQNEESDLDLLFEFNDRIGSRFIDLTEEIEKLTGIKVDLVSRKGVKDKYYQRIQSDLTYVWPRSHFTSGHMLESALKIKRYTTKLNYDSFRNDEKTIDAVVKNFEIIGEAANRIDPGFRLMNS